ncbi:DUF6438 domain-containing protein [Noviluteimonas gilva]|uniref:DUF6438 domain-containing protein n=1 Tax=Noviluteimonas gilva TaxID=2682097 RepID=A0A7C9HLV7_9GAMM|nr:DUF6438 domain-containing protein [Lysobacter gilvus]MUV14017.1 hypothetical protein [Lysobacter gilvus]
MRRALMASVLAAMSLAPTARAGDAEHSIPPSCSPETRRAFTPEREVVDAHRQFDLPVPRYAAGTRPEGTGIAVHVHVDATGKVTCVDLLDGFSLRRRPPVTPERLAALRSIAAGRYAPFNDDGGPPVAADFFERISEEDIPSVHRPMPDVPLKATRIRLERTACFGICPRYAIEVDGEGRVTYVGEGYVDVAGRHEDRIAPERVAQLVEQARAADFWSLRENYMTRVSDMSATTVTFRRGRASHTVEDYVGEWDGMPRAMSALEVAIEDAAESAKWINLSSETVDALVRERFVFDSPEGAQILMRAIANEYTHDEAAIARLVALGAPIGPIDRESVGWGYFFATPLEGALARRRPEVVKALLARGALGTAEHPDVALLNAAFRAAIEGGELASVQHIWNVAATHPSLSFESRSEASIDDEHARATKRAPVTLLLRDENSESKAWEGFAIARWLVEQGCDLHASDADGKTLLHIAARDGDLAMTRWLLANGADPSAKEADGDTPLDEALDEDVALALLDAGAKAHVPDLIRWARQFGWTRLQARLANGS